MMIWMVVHDPYKLNGISSIIKSNWNNKKKTQQRREIRSDPYLYQSHLATIDRQDIYPTNKQLFTFASCINSI